MTVTAAARDDEQFDPKRHKVYRVDVTLSYETFVIAADIDEAEEVAAAYEREERDQADPSYFVTQVKEPLAISGESLPWGPNQWGRDELTVNQAVALLGGETIPEPPPIVPPLAHLSDLEWVRKASGKVLAGVARVGANVVASDGFRLHLAPAGQMREGHWDPETGETIEAPFPKIDHLFPADGPKVALADLPAAWEVIRAAAEAKLYVSIPAAKGHARFDARYLADALLGAVGEGGPTAIRLPQWREPLKPLLLTFPELDRSALLMPVRVDDIASPGEYGLGAFVRPIEEAQP